MSDAIISDTWFHRPGGSSVLGAHPNHLVALALSLSAHVAAGFAIGGGGQGLVGGSGFRQPEAARVLTVRLEKPGAVETRIRSDADDSEPPDAPFSQRLTTPDGAVRQAKSETPALALLGASEAHYYRAGELTEKPRVQRDLSPDLSLNLPGVPPQTAVLRLLISESGDVDKVLVEESELPNPAARMVIETFSKLKFHPGKINDNPVKSQYKIEVMLDDAFPPP